MKKLSPIRFSLLCLLASCCIHCGGPEQSPVSPIAAPHERHVIHDLVEMVKLGQSGGLGSDRVSIHANQSGRLPTIQAVEIDEQFHTTVALPPGGAVAVDFPSLHRPLLTFRLGWKNETTPVRELPELTVTWQATGGDEERVYSSLAQPLPDEPGWQVCTTGLGEHPEGRGGVLRIAVSPPAISENSGGEALFFLALPRVVDTQELQPENQLEKYRNVVLITLDTTRRDHLSIYSQDRYGYRIDESITTEAIARLAQESVVFSRATTPMSSTGPAHSAMMTGKYPATVGVHGNGEALPEEFATLAETLLARGYDTGAFLSGFALKGTMSGLNQGFLTYDDVFQGEFRRWEQSADATVEKSVKWLEGKTGPYFLWVHFFDPHFRYSPPKPFDTLYDPDYDGPFESLLNHSWGEKHKIFTNEIGMSERDIEHARALYAGEISRVDEALEEILTVLRAQPNWEDTVVVIAGDHGDYLGEHGNYFHHNGIKEPLLNVPLLVRPGSGATGRRDEPVSLIDLTPTVLEVLGIENSHSGSEGISLTSLFSDTIRPDQDSAEGTPPSADRFLVAEFQDNFSIRRWPWKYTVTLSKDNGELRFDEPFASESLIHLEEDPFENTNLVGEATAQVHREELSTQLRRWLLNHRPGGGTDVEIKGEEQIHEALKALGYIEE